MTDKELSTINSSGELTNMQLGNVDASSRVLKQIEIDGKISTVNNKVTAVENDVTNNTQAIATLETEIQVGLRQYASKKYVDDSVVNVYAGTTVPNPSLGKDGDMYHLHTSATSTTVISGVSHEAYNGNSFDLFYDSASSGDIWSLEVSPTIRMIRLNYTTVSPHSDNYSINIGGTDIPLALHTDTATSVQLTYTSAFDSAIAGVTKATNFTLVSDILAGNESDYTKHMNAWYLTPIFSRTYDHTTAKDIVITGDTVFHDIASLTTPTRDAGLYSITFSTTATYSSTNKSFSVRWSLDDGTTWETYSTQPKDSTDRIASTYEFPYPHGGGAFKIKVQGKCESGTDTLHMFFANIMIERKK